MPELNEKKICLLFTNCHGGRIQQILRTHPEFSEDYKIIYYRADLRKAPLQEELKNCSLFIYQYLNEKKWKKLSSENLLKVLPKSCTSICIPKLSWRTFWPLWVQDPLKTDDPSYPYGRHPYGDSFLIEKTDRYEKKEKIIDEYLKLDLSKYYNLDKALTDNYNYLKRNENSKDIDLGDYIIENFKKKLFFAVMNHPCLDLLYKEVNFILNSLSYTTLKSLPANDEVEDWDYYLPIHPSIVQHFDLKFLDDDSLYYQYGTEHSFSDYVSDYIENRMYLKKNYKRHQIGKLKKLFRHILFR